MSVPRQKSERSQLFIEVYVPRQKSERSQLFIEVYVPRQKSERSQLFIEVSVPRQKSERPCICVGVSILPHPTNLIFDLEIVPTVWYILFCIPFYSSKGRTHVISILGHLVLLTEPTKCFTSIYSINILM